MSQRVASLIASMNLTEKIGQMTQLDISTICIDPIQQDFWDTAEIILDEEKLAYYLTHFQVGSFLNGKSIPVDQWIQVVKKIQELSLKHQLHQIPTLYGIDHVHGTNYLEGGTVFPHNINIGATFNLSYSEAAARVTLAESLGLGHLWNFAPILDVAQQPLYPRFHETFGEDPYLCAQMGKVYIEALQERGEEHPLQIAACAKHFLGYSEPKSGFDRSPSEISMQRLREYHLPPFQAAVDAGVRTFMINSGEINGIPVHASPEILTGLLREELGFEGVVVTDWEDVIRLHRGHRVAASMKEAVYLAITAGIDMSMTPLTTDFCVLLKELVEEGHISEERIDTSVRRILLLKEELGLFDQPYPTEVTPTSEDKAAFKQANYQSAVDSLVLLKNEDEILPLAADKKILVCGPNANLKNRICGGWTWRWVLTEDTWYPEDMRTILGGMQEAFGEEKILSGDRSEMQALSEEADVILFAAGEEAYSEGFGDILDLNLPEDQLEWLEEAIATGKPVVLVLLEGRPRTFPNQADKCAAIIWAGLPGLEGAPAIAAVLSGKENPSGKLPFTYPYKQGHVLPYNHKPSAFSDTQPFEDGDERWRYAIGHFGRGLSYTSFEYTDLDLSTDTLSGSDELTAKVTITNTGTRAGKEAVLWFLTDEYGQISRPVKMLKWFEKVELQPGESLSCEFNILPQVHLTYPDGDGVSILETGTFMLSVGNLKQRFIYE
ncbi:MAG: glycoside hydrolase family 3 N-terminal domain-containing protein [Bacteroidota bacterium]